MNNMLRLPPACALALGLMFLPSVAGADLADQAPLASLPYTPGVNPASFDHEVAPCADFYAYACGGWLSSHSIPADQGYTSVYTVLSDQIRRELWGLLQEAATLRPGRSESDAKLGDTFAACMDEEAIERRGVEPLLPVLSHLEAVHDAAGLATWLAEQQLAADGNGIFFGLGSMPDAKVPTRVIGVLQPGGLGLPDRDDYFDKAAKAVALRGEYVAHVEKLLTLAGDSQKLAKKSAALVMRLESTLADSRLTAVQQRDAYSTYHPTSLAELVTLAPALDWRAYFHAANVAEAARFDLMEPAFFTRLGSVLAHEKLADVKRYLRYALLNDEAKNLSRAFADEDFHFNRHLLHGADKPEPRWLRCEASVSHGLGELLGAKFLERHFAPDTRKRAELLLHGIAQAMQHRLATATWMSEATRGEALRKLARMEHRLGGPARPRDYGEVRVERDDFFGNGVRATRAETLRELKRIGQPVDREEWQDRAYRMDGSYHDTTNTIELSAGILLPPLFDPAMDDAPNYGDTGAMIGHELIHGFDDNGRQFDAEGALRDWWTRQDAARFQERAQCVADQFASYSAVDEVHVDGKLTLGENIADLSGLELAYDAFMATPAHDAPARRDGLTPEQRFFVGYAQWACEKPKPETARRWARTDPHSPSRYRVNGVLVNLPEFGRAFACKPGDAMVKPSSQLCRVW